MLKIISINSGSENGQSTFLYSKRWVILTKAFIIITWAAILPLMVPAHVSDRDIYVFVADRILAGDRLYVDVYDNKDPLFYYLVAAQISIGGIGEIAFEIILVAIATGS